MRKAMCLDIVAVILLAGSVAALGYHYWRGAYEGRGYPYSTYLFDPADTFRVSWSGVSERHCFGDLYQPYLNSSNLDPYGRSEGVLPGCYFPFAYVLIHPLTWVPYNWLVLIYLAGCALGLLWTARRAMALSNSLRDWHILFTIVLLSFPVHTALDRGNIDTIVFLITAGFLFCFMQAKYGWAVVLLACAAAMKGYPAILGLLYLQRGKFRYGLYAGSLTVFLALASAMLLRGGIVGSFNGLVEGLAGFGTLAGSFWGTLNCCSLRAALKALTYLSWEFHWTFLADRLLSIDAVYWAVQLLFASCIGWEYFRRRLTLEERIAIITPAMLLLPDITGNYRLIYVLLPMELLLRGGEETAERSDLLLAILFGLLLVPKAYYPTFMDVRIDSLLNPALMVLLLAVIVGRAARRERQHGATSSSADAICQTCVGACGSTLSSDPALHRV